MNSQLRKTIFRNIMLQHNLTKIGDKDTEEKFHLQKNWVTILKQNAIGKYFKNRCTNGSSNIHFFWKTIKPFMNEAYSSNSHVPEMLLENGEFIRDPIDLCNTFNAFFCNNGTDIIANEKDFNACLLCIQDIWKNQGFSFSFHTVSTSKVMKKFKSLNVKKAVGCDGIPTKLIKILAMSLVTSLTHLINESISTSVFPDDLKLADIKPAYKRKDTISKENYRPISILPILSKIFEGTLDDQLEEFFDNNLVNIFISIS